MNIDDIGMPPQERANLVSLLDEFGDEVGVGLLQDLDGYGSTIGIPASEHF
jgi:hypothetical protein